MEDPRGRSRHGQPPRRRPVGGDHCDDADRRTVAQHPIEPCRGLDVRNVVEGVAHGREAVDRHHDRRLPTTVGGASVELACESGEQPSEAFEFRYAHHCPAVGERLERRPGRLALRVDHVEVQLLGRRRSCASCDDRAHRRSSCRRRPHRRAAGCRHTASIAAGADTGPPDRRADPSMVGSSSRSRGWTTSGSASIQGRWGGVVETIAAAAAMASTTWSSTLGSGASASAPVATSPVAGWPAAGSPTTRSASVFDPPWSTGSTWRRPARRGTAPSGARRLEDDQLVGPEPERRPTGNARRESGRLAVADHIVGVGTVVQAQRDPQVGVGADVVGDDAGRPLRGEQQVDAEAASTLRHRHECAEELGQLLGERRELVDHHHEPRERSVDGAAIARQVVDAHGAQQPFASTHLGIEAHQHPFGEPVVEVGHHADGVRQPLAGVERRSALEVDEDHRDVVGARLCGERHHQRAQQLALARPGGAGDEPVGTVAYEVDVDDAVVRHPEPGDRSRVAPGVCANDGRSPTPRRRRPVRARRATRRSATPPTSSWSSGSISGANRRAAASAVATERPATLISRSIAVQGDASSPAQAAPPVAPTFEDPTGDRRHRSVRRHECDAAHVSTFEPTAHRPGAGAEQRRGIEHDHGAVFVGVTSVWPHRVGDRLGVVGVDEAGTVSCVREPRCPAPTLRVVGDHLELPVGGPVVGRQLHDHRSRQRVPSSSTAHGTRPPHPIESERHRDVDEAFGPLDRNQEIGGESTTRVGFDRWRPSAGPTADGGPQHIGWATSTRPDAAAVSVDDVEGVDEVVVLGSVSALGVGVGLAQCQLEGRERCSMGGVGPPTISSSDECSDRPGRHRGDRTDHCEHGEQHLAEHGSQHSSSGGGDAGPDERRERGCPVCARRFRNLENRPLRLDRWSRPSTDDVSPGIALGGDDAAADR